MEQIQTNIKNFKEENQNEIISKATKYVNIYSLGITYVQEDIGG